MNKTVSESRMAYCTRLSLLIEISTIRTITWTIGYCFWTLPRFGRSLDGNRKIFEATNKWNEGGGGREIARKSFVYHRDTLGKIWVYSTPSIRHTATTNEEPVALIKILLIAPYRWFYVGALSCCNMCHVSILKMEVLVYCFIFKLLHSNSYATQPFPFLVNLP